MTQNGGGKRDEQEQGVWVGAERGGEDMLAAFRTSEERGTGRYCASGTDGHCGYYPLGNQKRNGDQA